MLNSKERKKLVEFLNSENDEFDMSNYNTIIRLWNLGNSKKKVDKNLEMPYYKTINDNKQNITWEQIFMQYFQ